MIGIITQTKINIRAGMSTASADMGDLLAGDVIIGTVIDGWLAFDRVFRKTTGNAQAEVLGFTRYAAMYEPGIPTQKYMMLVDVGGSTPQPVREPLRIEVDGGTLYKSVNVELEPK